MLPAPTLLQVHNARLLGFGQPVEREARSLDADSAAGQAAAALTRVRLSLPPLPFLPSLPLDVSRLSCPSKASCEEAAEQQEEQEEGEVEGSSTDAAVTSKR